MQRIPFFDGILPHNTYIVEYLWDVIVKPRWGVYLEGGCLSGGYCFQSVEVDGSSPGRCQHRIQDN